jgi:hypothetical protein
MQQEPFPFWTSEKVHTYTEVQEFCARQYSQRGPGLIEVTQKYLEKYGKARSRPELLEVLLCLDELSLRLSCFNTVWVEFSEAVFEVLVLPGKVSITKTHKYLTETFQATLRRIDSGKQPGTN